MIVIEEEFMPNPNLKKYHIRNAPFYGVIHNIKAPDEGDPHDHPFSLTIQVLKGSYIERVFLPFEDGTYTTIDIERKKGDFFVIPANHIHKIISLPQGEYWSYMTPGEHIKNEDGSDKGWKHYHFDEANYRPPKPPSIPKVLYNSTPMHEYFLARQHQ